MQNGLQYKLLHSLLILAFVTVGISPACHFISGQAQATDYIEICTVYGIEKMPVTAAEQTPDRPAPDLTDVCQFCFSAQAQKAASDESARLFMSFDLVGATVSGGELALSGTVFVAAYHARAPPSLS